MASLDLLIGTIIAGGVALGAPSQEFYKQEGIVQISAPTQKRHAAEELYQRIHYPNDSEPTWCVEKNVEGHPAKYCWALKKRREANGQVGKTIYTIITTERPVKTSKGIKYAKELIITNKNPEGPYFSVTAFGRFKGKPLSFDSWVYASNKIKRSEWIPYFDLKFKEGTSYGDGKYVLPKKWEKHIKSKSSKVLEGLPTHTKFFWARIAARTNEHSHAALKGAYDRKVVPLLRELTPR